MTMMPGRSFGEMSLETGEGRKSTIITRTDVYCGLVHKEFYKKILQKLNEEKT